MRFIAIRGKSCVNGMEEIWSNIPHAEILTWPQVISHLKKIHMVSSYFPPQKNSMDSNKFPPQKNLMASINFPPQRVDWRVELVVSAEHSEKLSAENDQPEPQHHERRWR